MQNRRRRMVMTPTLRRATSRMEERHDGALAVAGVGLGQPNQPNFDTLNDGLSELEPGTGSSLEYPRDDEVTSSQQSDIVV